MINNTYTEHSATCTHLLVSLYEATQLEIDIVKWALLVKDKVNAYIGRTTDFSLSDLTTKHKAIVSAASQLTAAYIEANPQEKMPILSEEAKKDSDEAYAALDRWMKLNGMKASRSATIASLPIVRAEAGTYNA